MGHPMDLRHLRYFVAVAETGHFGRAAQQLHIVQPALSMQIRALEEEIGGPLLVRTSRRVELTEAGELLLVEARRTLTQAERTKAIVQRSLRGEIGSVKVAFAGNAVMTGLLMDALREFRRRYPEAQLELHEMAPHLQGEAILTGQVDVGYSPTHEWAATTPLVAQAVGQWPMMLAMSPDHPLAKRKRVSISLLEGEPVIMYSGGDGDALLERLRTYLGTLFIPAHRVSSTLSVLALAAAGLGVALVPAPLDKVAIPHLTYRPVAETDIVADLLLLSRANETEGAVRAFLALARLRSVPS
jgi:DNA-binding transcriptional LysR family regulator